MPRPASTDAVAVRTSLLETRLCTVFPLRFDDLEAMQGAYKSASIDDFMDMIQPHFHALDASAAPLSLTTKAGPAAARMAAAPPWLRRLTECIARYRTVTVHDTLSHPIAMLLVVSSSGPDPLNAFAQLYEASKHAADTDILRCYLVLHDTATAGSDVSRSLALLDEVKRTYGLQCALLPINSGAGAGTVAADLLAAEWAAPDLRRAPHASGPTWPGALLSTEDIARLRTFVRELVTKSLVPYLERNEQRLNEQVVSLRRGLANRLLGAGRKLFTARPPSPGYDAERDEYPPASVTAQTRRLADLAFHVRDYRLAAQMYDAVRRDAVTDHATTYAAAAGEMLLLTRAAMAPAASDLDALLCAVCEEYAAIPGGRLRLLRAAVLYSNVQRQTPRYESVAHALLRGALSADEVMRGVLLEGAARAYLGLPRPHARKSAGLLLQAAAQYELCAQKTLARACLGALAAYYDTCAWPALHDHVLFHLARLAHASGEISEALTFLVRLVHPAPLAETAQHMDELCEVAKYADTLRCELPTPMWIADACEIVSASEMPLPALEAAAASVPSWDRVVGVGESFSVRLYVRNPLSVPVTLTDTLLHFVDESAIAPPVAGPTVTLEAYEQRTVLASADIATPGTYRLAELTYTLADVVRVRQPLVKRGARLNATAEQRRSCTYAPDTTLVVRVRNDVPHITGAILDPASAAAGELVRVSLCLTNQSASVAHNVRVLAAPASVQVTELSDASTDLPRALDAALSVKALQLPPLSAVSEPHYVGTIAPRASTTLTYTVHVTTPLDTHLQWLVLYQNALGESLAARVQHRLAVQPLLSANFRVGSGKSPHTLVELVNHSDEVLAVEGLSLVSAQWIVRAITSPPLPRLPPGRMSVMVQLEHRDADDTLAATLEHLRPYFEGAPPSDAPQPPLDVFCSTLGSACVLPVRLYAASRSMWRRAQLAKDYAFLPPVLLPRAFPPMDTHDVDVIVSWSLGERRGASLLCGARIGAPTYAASSLLALAHIGQHVATRAMYESTAVTRAAARTALLASPLAQIPMPVSVCAEMPSELTHNFDNGFCAAPVTLHVHNASPWSLSYTLRLLTAGASGTSVMQPIAPWLGRLAHRGLLAPWTTEAVHTHALVSTPGSCQIGDWQCAASLAVEGVAVRTFVDAGSAKMPLVVQAAAT